jgi:hypothetical protein
VTSNIDPTVPASGAPLASAPVRSNFSVARNEITALQTQVAAIPAGPQGPPGQAATIAAGTTTTGAPGTNANVVNAGSSSAAVFNFTIPAGVAGATGNAGATGPAGVAATVAAGTTTTGAPGTSASVTNSGTSAAAVFNFTIPRGDVGATGPQGPPGSSGTGTGTVNSGTGPQIAQYAAGTGTVVGGVTLSGDATIAAGGALTLNTTVNPNVGTFQGLTLNGKGQVTAATNQNYVTGGPYLPTAGGIVTGSVQVGTPTAPSGGMLAGDVNAQRLFSNSTTGSLAINQDPLHPPAAVAGEPPAPVEMQWPDGQLSAVRFRSSSLTRLDVWKSGGTNAVPAPNGNNSTLFQLNVRGYGTSNWTGLSTFGSAAIQVYASEPATDAAQGTRMTLYTTARGTSGMTAQVSLERGLIVGENPTVSAKDMGTGTLNLISPAAAPGTAGVYLDGVRMSTGGGVDTVTGGITASTTLTQAGATVLTSQFNIVTIAATTTGPPYAGVALPTAPTAGGHCLVRNSGANPISVYPATNPATNAIINAQAANAPITVLTNTTAYFECQSATQWFTVP